MRKLHLFWLLALLAAGATPASAGISLSTTQQCSDGVFAGDENTTAEEDVVVVVVEEEEEPECD